MYRRRFSRRRVLQLGGTGLVSLSLGSSSAQAKPFRIGVVLPSAGDRFRLDPQSAEIAGNGARRGAVLADEESDSLGRFLGPGLEVLFAAAPNEDSAARAAGGLAARDEVQALVGGIGAGQARALAGVARDHDILFFNIGSTDESFRYEDADHVFNVEASAAMYLEALARWFTAHGVRSWLLVHNDESDSRALLRRAERAVQGVTGGVADVSTLAVPESPIFEHALSGIRNARPDLVVLMLDWRNQLEFLGRYEAAGLEAPVTPFPTPATQTREFFEAVRSSAPRSGTGPRAALWDASLDSEGARELNASFFARWGRPIDAPAWATYQAVAALARAASEAGSHTSSDLIRYFRQTSFDVGKGRPASFDAEHRQLEQPLYIVSVDPDAEEPAALGRVLAKIDPNERQGVGAEEAPS